MMCEDLLGSQPAPELLDLDRFGYLRGGEDVVESWWRRAWDHREANGGEVFEAFIYAWIAFNGWAECVSGEEQDARWVRALSFDERLKTSFEEHARHRSDRALSEFSARWPVPKVQDIRRQTPQADISAVPEEKARFFAEHNIKHAPQCWLVHEQRGEPVPIDWPHFLAAAYRVRCNLFHGEKSLHDRMDAAIVRSAFRGLVLFLGECEYFSPGRSTRAV